jgi:hypothetical protein
LPFKELNLILMRGVPMDGQAPRNQPRALALGYFELLDRKLDRLLRIGLIVDDANELTPASRGAVNAPGVAFRVLGRFGHGVTIAKKARGGVIDRPSARIFDLDQRPSLTPKYRLLLRHFPARSTLPSAHGVPNGSGHVQGTQQGETLMRKVASIGLAIGALTVTALPVRADDQSISIATGAIGGQQGAFRATPWVPPGPGSYGRYPYSGYAYSLYGGSPYGGYASSDGYVPQNCTYIGGPKGGNWTCW